MEMPLLRDAAPEFAAELRMLLRDAGEHDLAAQVEHLKIVDRCRCGDDFCSTFYTAPRPNGPWAPLHYTIGLNPGMLHVDVLGDKIVCVEVLSRDDVRTKIHAALP